MIEIDVGSSNDGSLYLMHDYFVNRTTNGTGRMAKLRDEEIESLRTNSGYRIPTLEEILQEPLFQDLLIFVDMKSLSNTTDRIGKWKKYTSRLIWDFQSFEEAMSIKESILNIVLSYHHSLLFICLKRYMLVKSMV